MRTQRGELIPPRTTRVRTRGNPESMRGTPPKLKRARVPTSEMTYAERFAVGRTVLGGRP